MNSFLAVIYGFIQGVTEFLPVSSSGHLALVPFFSDFKDPGVVFDLLMHLGTAIAVIGYFHKEVIVLIKQFFTLVFKGNLKDTLFVQNFLLSTFFSFILILLIKDLAFEYGRSPAFIAFNLIFFGLLMYIADRRSDRGLDLTKTKSFKNAALIGLSQSLAVFPGVSRSGITLTSSRYLGMSRLEAGRYSFLLSLPVILGSIVFKLPEILSGQATYVSFDIIISGVLSSFVFGLLTIHFFLKLISKLSLGHFTIYRVILGGVLIFLLVRN